MHARVGAAEYVRRGGCGHFVGVVSLATTLEVLRTKSHGLFDLRVFTDECASLGGLGGGWCQAVLRFDGTRYVTASEKRSARPYAP